MSVYYDYPNEPIGDENPYWRCKSCKRSDPEINGDIEGHYRSCTWRRTVETLIAEGSAPQVAVKIVSKVIE